MEMIYRGYPQMMNLTEQTEEKRLRVTESESQSVEEERKKMRREYEYFLELYPLDARRWQRFVEAEMDQNDRPGSGIYDEYPDRELIYRIRDRVIEEAEGQSSGEQENLVHVLVLNEMFWRRAERR